MSHSEDAPAAGLIASRKGAKFKLPDAEPATLVAIDLLRHQGLRSWQHHHPECKKALNWQWAATLPAFGRLVLSTVYDMSGPGNVIDARSTALAYQSWTKPFFVFMSNVWNGELGHSDGVTATAIPVEAFAAFKRHINERVAAKAIKSKTGYGYKGAITRILEWIWETNPEALGPGWRKQTFVHDEFDDDYKQREPYSATETRRLLDACVNLLQESVRDGTALESRAPHVELASYTLIGLRLGIETECLDGLTVGDVRPSSDGKLISIRYLKKRAPSNPRRSRRVDARPADGPGQNDEVDTRQEEVGSLKSSGGVLALLLRRASLMGAGSDALLWPRALVAKDFDWFTNFLGERGLRCDVGAALKVDRTRFRVTYKTAKNVRHQGMLDLMPEDNSRAVNAKHYLENDRMKPIYDQAIENAANQALAYALEKPKVVALGEDATEAEILEAAADIGVPAADVAAALKGETDVWISSCRDFYNSPFDKPGAPCSKSFYGCLGCRNALITRRVLPRLLRFYSHMTNQRPLLSSLDWQTKFGVAHRQITDEVLPRFPRAILAEAKIIAQGMDAEVHLPPEMLS